MALLILRDVHGRELERQPITADERYHLYRCCAEHTLLTLGGKRYAVEHVAWRIPEEECRCLVRFDSWALPDGC